MPLVIYSLGGGHTHTHILTSWTKAILRNQAHAGLLKIKQKIHHHNTSFTGTPWSLHTSFYTQKILPIRHTS